MNKPYKLYKRQKKRKKKHRKHTNNADRMWFKVLINFGNFCVAQLLHCFVWNLLNNFFILAQVFACGFLFDVFDVCNG